MFRSVTNEVIALVKIFEESPALELADIGGPLSVNLDSCDQKDK